MKKFVLVNLFAIIALFSCNKRDSEKSIVFQRSIMADENFFIIPGDANVNTYNFIGDAHNNIMNQYAHNMNQFINQPITFDEFIDFTIEKTEDYFGLKYNSDLEFSFRSFIQNRKLNGFYNLNSQERFIEIQTNYPALSEFIYNFKIDIYDYFCAFEGDDNLLLSEMIQKLNIIESNIISETSLSESEIEQSLIFVSVFKYSFFQIITEFSNESHPMHYYYFGENAKAKMTTADKMSIALADGHGALEGGALGLGGGPVGVMLCGAGGAAIESLGAAAVSTTIGVFADMWNNW